MLALPLPRSYSSAFVALLATSGFILSASAIITPRHARFHQRAVPVIHRPTDSQILSARAYEAVSTTTIPPHNRLRERNTHPTGALAARDGPVALPGDIWDLAKCTNPNPCFSNGVDMGITTDACNALSDYWWMESQTDTLTSGAAMSLPLNDVTKCQASITPVGNSPSASFLRKDMLNGLKAMAKTCADKSQKAVYCRLAYQGGNLDLCIAAPGQSCSPAGSASSLSASSASHST